MPAQCEYPKETRINRSHYRKELLRGSAKFRDDARFEKMDIDVAGETLGDDPPSIGISGVFVATVHD